MQTNILKLLWQDYLRFYKIDITVVFLSLLNVSICLLVFGKLLRNLIDHGLTFHSREVANYNMIIMVALVFLFVMSSFFRSFFINNLSEKIVNKIKIRAYQQCLSLTITQFDELKIGDLTTRLSTDLDMVGKLIVDFLSFFLRNAIMLLGSLVLMFTQNAKLAFIIIIIVPLLLLPLRKLSGYVRKLSQDSLYKKSLIYSNLLENLTNIKSIYAFNQEQNRLDNFQCEAQSYLESTKNRLKARSLFFSIAVAMILLSITLVIWIGVNDIITGETSSGQMISFIYYALICGMSAAGIAELFGEGLQGLSASERVFELINSFGQKREHLIPDNNLDNIHEIESIKFRNISFAYPSRMNIQVLDNISFTITKGEFIGIMGKSGSGKTSIMQLLLKFYLYDKGQILINEQAIDQLAAGNVRKKIAYVPQEPAIFSGSIRSNIIFGRTNITEARISEIAHITGITDFATKLDLGLNSEIGARGIKLSGGQKQRIAIARALISQPEILLLDEATSALDVDSEGQILTEIKKIMQNKITISIAHRVSSISTADRIFIIDNGNITQHGTHQQLLQKSLYYQYAASITG